MSSSQPMLFDDAEPTPAENLSPLGDFPALAPTLVRASAGTGKTYQLTARLLKILLQGAAPETILATTFTRKAAGEILNRLLLALASAADEKNDQALSDLQQQVGIPSLSRQSCLNLLDKLLRNIHRLRISTLDSLFAQLARSFPFELGLPPAWRLTDEIEEAWLRERAVESVISTLEPAEMMTLLAMLGKGEVKRSIAFELQQVVTTAYSLQRQSDAKVWNKIKATKLPENELITRTAGIFRQAAPKQKSLVKKLEAMAELLETRQFAPLTDETLVTNVFKARSSKEPVKLGRSKFDESLDESFDVLYAIAKSEMLRLLCAQNEATGSVLGTYDYHIGQLKQSSRALGFNDVAVRLANQFAKVDSDSLTNRMDGAIDHLLLDEFQDTSPIQWQVLRPLAMRAASQETGTDNRQEWRVDRSFFCVGDTKQAIYGWRGGVAEIFDAVADQIDGVQEAEQNKSFRSSPVVLDVVTQTFKNLKRHPLAASASGDIIHKATHEANAIVDFAKRFPIHTSAKEELAGYVTLQTARKVDGDAAARKQACYEDAADLIAQINRDAPDKTIGVLTRSNSVVAQIIFLLQERGVHASQEGGNPLTDSVAVELILSALMCAEHPGDLRWAFHIQQSPLGEFLETESDSTPGSTSGHSSSCKLGNRVRKLVEEHGLSESIEILAGKLAPNCDRRETLRLRQLTQLAMTYQQNAAPRLRDFVRLVREKRVERPQRAPVRVMTVHQAKGLEFDAVVLPEFDSALTRGGSGCVADVPDLGQPPKAITRSVKQAAWHFLPRAWQQAFGDQAAGEMTEAMCLMYVAMTRAKQALHIVIQPPTKSAFETKTPSSLLYHSLECEEDPTQGRVTLFETGDPNWYQEGETPAKKTDEVVVEKAIQFQPLPPVPRRNRID
ncbi:UvrD-helicase domain-containing protein [Planctomycetes bacterium K23_9]|uniref:DNA 3'-5' helicase n=1 Tax=Stieleria marina TaxID=1930275 RepID=A0A517NYU5_9BACT|nr:ATP-dependent helicase/nuclease subunit A [Planctomycetes bacterium K23_9]